jgi:hypothetical protein
MKMKQLIFAAVFLTVYCHVGRADLYKKDIRDTIRITDFDARPGSRENIVPAVRKALEECRKLNNPVLFFPEGRYDFWPQHCTERVYYESNTQDINPKRLAVLIEGIEGLTVDGGGSQFIFHDRMQPFTIDNGRDIFLKNFSVDWDIPLTAQSKITAVTDEYVEIHINKVESPYIIEEGKLFFVGEGWKSPWWGVMEFTGDTRIVVPQTGGSCFGNKWENYRATEVEEGIVRLHYQFTRKPAVGNWLVMRHSNRDHAGIFILESKYISIENVNLYHYPGLGILSQYSENLSFINVNCVPNENKGRILAGHDDGFQYSNCKGDVIVKNCTFHALMDDPINVHGTSVRVMEKINEATLLCKFMHHESVGMRWAYAGDSVGFIDNESMNTYSYGIIKSFRRIDNELFEVSFVKEVPKSLIAGHALENLTWTCNVAITGSRFRSCRARGILISTPGRVLIEDNIFESSGSAILIAGDANNWYESGGVKSVRISRNRFEAPCMTSDYQFCEGVISIFPTIPKINDKTPAFHSNISITENEFHLYDYPILYALSVENVKFTGNRLIRSHRFEPYHNRKYGLTFEYCKNISVQGNTSEGEVLGKDILLKNSHARELHIGKDDFFKKNNIRKH